MKTIRNISLILSVLLLISCSRITNESSAKAPFTAEPTAGASSAPVTVMPVLSLAPTPMPTPEPTPEPTPAPTPEPTPVPSPFGIVWISDTQHYSYYHPEKLAALGEWIADHEESDHLAAVIHTGDIVDNGHKQWQWDYFAQCLNQFRDDLVFLPVAGNHDLGIAALTYDGYLKQDFLDDYPDEQKYEGGKMLYTVLGPAGSQVLFLGIGWGIGETADEKAWIEQVMLAHGDIPCVIVTHAYSIRPDRLLSYAEYLESSVVARYPNVRMVLCGHVHQGFFTAEYEYDDDGDGTADRKVYSMLLDDQENSLLYRVLTFDPVSRSLSVKTYALESDQPVPDNEYGPADFVIGNAF